MVMVVNGCKQSVTIDASRGTRINVAFKKLHILELSVLICTLVSESLNSSELITSKVTTREKVHSVMHFLQAL